MPYAEDYDAAADALETAAQATATLLEPARAALDTGVMVGGRLSVQVADGLDAAGVVLDQVTAELSQLGQACQERAEICRQALAAQQAYASSYAAYESDLRDWQDAGDADRTVGTQNPDPPQPPSAPMDAPQWVNR